MDRVELAKFIRDKFNDSELRDLCFELHIDYESLPGEGKAAKARELVSFCERRDRLPELERTARQMLAAGAHSSVPAADRAREKTSLQRQLAEARENLRLIEDRKAEYVLGVEVPLQLIKEERRWHDRIAELEAKLRG